MTDQLECPLCRNPIVKKKSAYLVKHDGYRIWFDRAICLSVWIDNKRRMAAQAAGLEFRS